MRIASAFLAAGAVASALAAQNPRLGTISFPTSGPPAAQQQFITGVLYLHSFEYGSARRAFREAERVAPDFAMAYWGEAMTYNHPLWNERNRDSALAALSRLGPSAEARRARAPTDREKMYLDAIEALWAEGPKAVRDTAYERAMQRLVRAYPDDVEARAFWALAILGLSQGVRVVPSYMRAAAIAEEIFRDNPDHPGAAHYLIHSYDDPTHAPLGLRAARAYSRIAPDAAHAQHMTTHIFLALGMWDEVVSQNTIASGSQLGPGHYTAWWNYGLLQQGRFDSARTHLARARSETGSVYYLATMRAHYVVNTEQWDDPALAWVLDLSHAALVPRAIDAFTQGYAALNRGDLVAARTSLTALEALQPPRAAGGYTGGETVTAVLRAELASTILFSSGRQDSALALLRQAVEREDAMPFDFGPPDIVKPSHELLGEMLLAMGRPAEAQHEFERALALAPRRALSLLGLARAATAAGDTTVARSAWSDLGAIWHDADQGLPGLAEARRYGANLP